MASRADGLVDLEATAKSVVVVGLEDGGVDPGVDGGLEVVLSGTEGGGGELGHPVDTGRGASNTGSDGELGHLGEGKREEERGATRGDG